MNSLEKTLELALSGSRSIIEPETEFSDYSLSEAINSMIGGQAPSRATRAASESCRSIAGTSISGTYIPFSGIAPRRTRDLLTTDATGGGALVQNDMHAAIRLLKNKCVAVPLGARVISGLRGNAVFPRVLSTLQAQSLAETAAVTASNVSTGQDGVQSARVSAEIVIGKQLLIQTDSAAEDYLRQELSDQIALAVDRLVLFGQGAGDEPLGITNTLGIGSAIYGGSATWAKVVAHEGVVSGANADYGNRLGWALSPSTRNAWKTTPKIAGYPKYIMKGDSTVNGYPSLVSNQLSGTHKSIFGAWDSLLILIWGNGLDFIYDDVTSAKIGKVVLCANLFWNILPLYPQAFVVSADAANQ